MYVALELYTLSCSPECAFALFRVSSAVMWGGVSVGVLGASLVLYVVVACRGSVFVYFSIGIGGRWTTDGCVRFGGVRRLSARKKARITSVQQSVPGMDEGTGVRASLTISAKSRRGIERYFCGVSEATGSFPQMRRWLTMERGS